MSYFLSQVRGKAAKRKVNAGNGGEEEARPSGAVTRRSSPYPRPLLGHKLRPGKARDHGGSFGGTGKHEATGEHGALTMPLAPSPQPHLNTYVTDRAKGAHRERVPFQSPFSLSTSLRSQLDPTMTPLPSQRGRAPAAAPTVGAGSTNIFRDVHNSSVRSLHLVHSKTVHDHLEPYVAQGAAYNSDERCDAPACHPETRAAMRERAVSWIRQGDSDNDPTKIMWLSGPAGSGKTALAGTVARACAREGLLAASFFFSSFSSSAGRCSKRCVITTMASHLAEHQVLHEFKEELLSSIERNPSIFRKSLRAQAECLLLAPLRFLQGHRDTTLWPKGIILDGLDEVVAQQHRDPARKETSQSSEEDQVEILDVLLTLSQSPSFPFRIFIASRPERHITHFFHSPLAQVSTVALPLDSKYDPDSDIRLFLQSKFAQIRRRARLPDSMWPGQGVTDRLVEMSSGQFIVPTTIIRWIESGLPQQRLDEVLRLQQQISGSKNPCANLDALYCHILEHALTPAEDSHLVVKWILSIVSATLPRRTFYPHAAIFWRGFLEDDEGELDFRMAPITSLMSIPPPHDLSSPITIYHKSLTDFLSNKERCGDLYVDETRFNSFLADRIVMFLKGKGPMAPRTSSSYSSRDILADLLDLKLVAFSFATSQDLVSQHTASFLGSLSLESQACLASCDVAWWAGLSSLTDRSLIEGIYCGIHKALCGSNAPPSGSLSHHTVQGHGCHPACVHWRSGILATAKKDNWCVHELEEVSIDRLEGLTFEDVESKVRKLGRQEDGLFLPPCDVCQSSSNPRN